MKNLATVLLVTLLVGLVLWLKPWSSFEQPQGPEVSIQASNLSQPVRAELLAEMAIKEKELDRIELQLQQAEEHPGQSLAVSPAKVEEVLKTLGRIESSLQDPALDGQQLSHAREDIRDLWRDRAISLRQYLLEARSDVPEMPPLDRSLAGRLGGALESESYRSHYERLEQHRKRLVSVQSEAFMADLAGRAERLTRVSWLRYHVLQRLARLNWMRLFESPGPWLEDCLFELSCYPDRKYGLYLLARGHMERRTGGGRMVYLATLKELGQALLGLLLLSTCLVSAARRDRLRPPGFRGVWTWLAIWPVCQLGLALVSGGVAECLRPIFALGALYALYRAYLQLAGGPLLQTIVQSQVGQKVGVRTRALRDLTIWGRAFWIAGTCDAVALTLGGPGLLAATTESVMDLLVKLLYWLLSWNWRVELGEALSALLPGSPQLGRWVGSMCSATVPGLLLAPLAVPLVMLLGGLHWLVRRTVRYDWAKRMSAGVLRRWMEAAAHDQAGGAPVSGAYSQAFRELSWSAEGAWQLCSPGFCPQLEGSVREWKENPLRSHSMMIVHGPDGSGREDAADRLEAVFGQELRVLRWELSRRLTTEKELLAELAGVFELEAPLSPEALRAQPPTLLIVTQAQRLFLARLGGFQAIDRLHQMLLGCRANLFGCLIFPTQAQRYLRMVVSERWTISLSLALPRWTESALKAMLLARHAAAGGELHYSTAVLRAAEATPGVSPETYYFHILREVSWGNPAVACELWLEAARVDADGHLVIGLPPRKPAHLLAGLPTVAAYLLAAVMRHGELTRAEAAEVTALPASQLMSAWERCQELGVLGGESSLSVTRPWLADVAHFLRERNLLDGD